LIAALDWVVANKSVYGIEAVNMSLGTPECSDGVDAESAALEAAHDAGLVMATAAGNEGPGRCTVGSPGAAPKALTVGAMADMGELGFFQWASSSRGKTADGRVKPDVSAPGFRITSANNNTAAGYVTSSGTSMATPFVAGVALLMLEANPALTPQNVKDKIMQTAEDWGRGPDNAAGTTGADPEYGAGKLDAYSAMESAGAPLGAPPAGPEHVLREGTLSGAGTQIDFPITVRDTRFPIAATLIIPQIVGGSAGSPDFDLFLRDPGGATVAQSTFSTRQEEVGFQPTQMGTYTVRVRSFTGSGGFFVDVSAGLDDPGYVRPAGATPVRASLVPAFAACAAGANRVHAPPLAHASCSPPAQVPGQLTVGTPEVNGVGPGFSGFVRLQAVPGDPQSGPDEADVAFRVRTFDVRVRGSLADYTGELETRLGIRLTDRLNGTTATDSATVQDLTLRVPVACTATAAAGTGAACEASTSADALAAGTVVEGKRAVWQLSQVQVFDGGTDGLAATTSGNSLFAVQGVLVP
jgi:hypothetical protein